MAEIPNSKFVPFIASVAKQSPAPLVATEEIATGLKPLAMTLFLHFFIVWNLKLGFLSFVVLCN
jgi:hypothetical protein